MHQKPAVHSRNESLRAAHIEETYQGTDEQFKHRSSVDVSPIPRDQRVQMLRWGLTHLKAHNV